VFAISSHVRIQRVLQDGVAFDQLADAIIQQMCRRPASGQDARVGNDVIPLVGILPDGRLEINKFRQMLLDGRAEFELGEVGIPEGDILSAESDSGRLQFLQNPAGELLRIKARGAVSFQQGP
jgi:hypothetical protein